METGDPTDEAHRFHIAPEDAGARIDSWLHGQFPDLSRSLLKRYIQEQRVTIDGDTVKPSATLRAGATVEICIPPPPEPFPLPEEIPLEILHQDDAIIVIQKTPDMVVHPSAGGAHAGGTIVNALLGLTEDLSSDAGQYRPGIVHRLDRETSGLLVVARSDHAHRCLAAQFKERRVKKEYLALCHGVPKEARGEVDLPLGRSLRDRKKMAVRTDEGGKPSHTAWQVEKQLGRLTWLRLFPTTGRTHQIRVHLKALGHPIVCDATYGREKRITLSEIHGRRPGPGEEPILTRQALHAARLSFTHPDSDETLTFEAPLPPDLATLWKV